MEGAGDDAPRGEANAGRGGGGDARASILEAALELFGERGYGAVPVEAVARRAGVSKANVFHHFGSKEGLYREAVGEACRRTAAFLEEGRGEQGVGAEDLAARVEALVQGHLRAMLQEEAATRLLLREVLEDGPLGARELAERCITGRFAELVGLLAGARGGHEGGRGADPALLATVLVGADVFYFLARRVLAHLPGAAFAGDPERYGRGVARLLVRGMQGAQGGSGRQEEDEHEGDGR